jgi:hypothetical protein
MAVSGQLLRRNTVAEGAARGAKRQVNLGRTGIFLSLTIACRITGTDDEPP